MRHLRNTLLFAVTLLGAVFFAHPVLAETVCNSPTIKLEVGVGSASSVKGMANYIVIMYEFIISIIGVLSAIMIMYAGIMWAAANGNSEKIGNAKQRLVNAIVGLVIALASFLILYTINPNLINISEPCPDDLLIPASASGEWTKCTGSASGCSSVDYCKYTGGCSCDAIGDVQYCRPIGQKVIPKAGVCKDSTNCVEPFICDGATSTAPGLCLYGSEGAACESDQNCKGGDDVVDGMECVTTPKGGQCLPDENRANGSYCVDSDECISHACNTTVSLGQPTTYGECMKGDGSDTLNCTSDDHCTYGYHCVAQGNAGGKCIAKVDGDSCSTNDYECGGTLFCVEVGLTETGTCYNGTDGTNGTNVDPCDANTECQSGKCAQFDTTMNYCTTGEQGARCDVGDKNDCKSGLTCYDDWGFNNTCQPPQ